MELRQDTFDFFAACQRSKSALRMKNFRPIWTIRMRSSSMILRKCRTENPASSAALGISRNIRLGATPSDAFMLFLLVQDGKACGVPRDNGKRGHKAPAYVGGGFMPPFPARHRISGLLFAEVGVSIIGRRNQRFFDRADGNPADQVEHGTRLVVGTAGSGSTE